MLLRKILLTLKDFHFDGAQRWRCQNFVCTRAKNFSAKVCRDCDADNDKDDDDDGDGGAMLLPGN